MFDRARARLTAWYAATFLVLLVLLGAGMYVALTRSLDRQVDEGIDSVASEWQATAPDPNSLPPLPVNPSPPIDPDDTFLVVFRADGAVVADPLRTDATPFASLRWTGGTRPDRGNWHTMTTALGRSRVQVRPLIRNGTMVGTIVVGRSLTGRDAQVRAIAITLGAAETAGLLLAIAAGYLLAGRALRPLAEAYDRQRMFVADASHELRAPITVIRTAADLLLAEQPTEPQRAKAETIRDVADEAGKLVGQLLELARLQAAPDEPAPAAIDLTVAVTAELKLMAPLLQEHRTMTQIQLQPAWAKVRAEEVGRLLRILLENVVAHTPPGTGVHIATVMSGGRARLIVTDDGPGVPADAHRNIFERFVRLDRSRARATNAGTGLGLAIARAIAVRRGGDVTASSSPHGGGLQVEVVLPGSPAPGETGESR